LAEKNKINPANIKQIAVVNFIVTNPGNKLVTIGTLKIQPRATTNPTKKTRIAINFKNPWRIIIIMRYFYNN
jgi:hypothetical protein